MVCRYGCCTNNADSEMSESGQLRSASLSAAASGDTSPYQLACQCLRPEIKACCTPNSKATDRHDLMCAGWRKTGAVNPQCTSFLPHTILYIMTDRGAASS